MANTVTQEEYLQIKDEVLTLAGVYIKNKVDKANNGIRWTKQVEDNLQDIVIYLKSIDTWEQGKFTNIEYSNYFNSNDLLLMYSKIKKLTYVC